MAELRNVFEGSKPEKGDIVDVIVRGNQLLLCNEHPSVWIELRVSNAEKTSIMKALVKDFLEVK